MADEDESACNLGGRKRKRGLAAVEPREYVGDAKTCPNPDCDSTEQCVFKYLNNGKRDQPRYQCLRCNHMHTHYPPGKKRPRPHGKTYTKHTLANPPEHNDLFDLRCPNPACAALESRARFLYYNNNKPLQPRYRCLVCNVPWQPKLKPTLPAQPDLEGVPPQADYDHNVDSCYATASAAPPNPMQEFVPPQETSYYNPELDPANLGPGGPNYPMGMMQCYSQLQQPYDYPADHDVNSMGSCTLLYPDGDPNYMNVLQGSQSQQQYYYYPTDPANSMGSCPEYVANVNYTMQGQQPFSESHESQYVELGGGDSNVNYYTMQGDQQPCSEIPQDPYFVNSLGRCTHHDPSITYITVMQAGDPDGHISMQAGDAEQFYPPEGCSASSDTLHVDANAIEAGEEQYAVYPALDPALSSATYALDAPEDTDQWISELLAVDG